MSRDGRSEGRIVRWNDDRGFGFVVANGEEVETFAHISAFRQRRFRPAVGDRVRFARETGKDGRLRATDIVQVEQRFAAGGRGANHVRRSARSGLPLRGIAAAVLGLIVIATGWHYLRPPGSPADGPSASIARRAQAARFQCEGKVHCSEMRSCAEARFYIANCPGTRMDGDGDGNPCEDQHCRH